MSGTVRIVRDYGFIVDDGHGGSCWEEDHADIDEVACETVEEAIDAIRNSGATEANGGDDFYDPDGSRTVRFRDDYRVSTYARVYGFSDRDMDAINRGVIGTRCAH